MKPTAAALIATVAFAGAEPPSGEELGCRHNLRLIREALDAYAADHDGEFPDKLSTLLDGYLSDARTLACPLADASGTGGVSADPLAPVLDPSDFDSAVKGYGWELSPDVVLGFDGGAERSLRLGHRPTLRDWKYRQFETPVGRWVPVVRCRLHDRALNLAVGGAIYKSDDYWEFSFRDVFPTSYLMPGNVFRDNRPIAERLPPRPPGADSSMLDLGPWSNGTWEEPWKTAHIGDELREFAYDIEDGIFSHNGIAFEPRALIQVLGPARVPVPEGEAALGGEDTPPPGGEDVFKSHGESVSGIDVGKRCRRIHFLAAHWAEEAAPGTPVAHLVFNRGSSSAPLETTWKHSEQIGCFLAPEIHVDTPETRPGSGPVQNPAPAWSAPTTFHKQPGPDLPMVKTTRTARLYHVIWENPDPGTLIESFDFQAGEGFQSPFILGVTVEE